MLAWLFGPDIVALQASGVGFIIYAIIAIVSGLLLSARAAKPPKAKPLALEDFQVPTAEDGRDYPVLYGTCWFADPNITWYGDLRLKQHTISHQKHATKPQPHHERRQLPHRPPAKNQLPRCMKLPDCTHEVLTPEVFESQKMDMNMSKTYLYFARPEMSPASGAA